MNYIVFDLEWNQSPSGHAGEHPRMPFEIIEIGAVKLDDNYKMIDEFQQLVKPKLYPKIHKYIKDILNYDENDLKRDGIPFKEACTKFLDWCEESPSGEKTDYIFCSWGPSDLSYFQANMDFYYMKKLDFPLKFYDIQQIFAEKYTKDNSVSKLEKAVDKLKLDHDRPFHAAINDAYYTARILQEGKFGDISDKYVYDTYRYPRNRTESVHDFHNGTLEEIYGEYASKKDALSDKRVTDIRCVKCGRKTSNKIKAFQVNNTTDLSVGVCFRHGRMLSTIKFRPASESMDTVFVVKKIYPISKSKYTDVKRRKDVLAEKKRERDKRYMERKQSEKRVVNNTKNK
ncbi:MAG: exonuclease domain-containing protein [Eubacterium sp.]|nr:exonuclease domain-containing protein [Eubacterium sp.]